TPAAAVAVATGRGGVAAAAAMFTSARMTLGAHPEMERSSRVSEAPPSARSLGVNASRSASQVEARFSITHAKRASCRHDVRILSLVLRRRRLRPGAASQLLLADDEGLVIVDLRAAVRDGAFAAGDDLAQLFVA